MPGLTPEHTLSSLRYGSLQCECVLARHQLRLVAVTGGPGAGETAVLELAARSFCRHVAVLPEAASIVFGGGFPRHSTGPGRRAAQRAIYRVQREVERLIAEEEEVAIALCDRGTVDGLAYWPDPAETFWKDVDSDLPAELGRYRAIINLGTPTVDDGLHRRSDSGRVGLAALELIRSQLPTCCLSHRLDIEGSSNRGESRSGGSQPG